MNDRRTSTRTQVLHHRIGDIATAKDRETRRGQLLETDYDGYRFTFVAPTLR